ncbi:type IV secretion system DNA-binding domain-containing protein [Sphingobacterium faecium]|uniref:type IV secretion system DNA-binding domain-containing protein n=1 Tax=Sphingobacterium faecium TaxID=34087 RepID=UPI0024682701|nr:type IV secretion system DNA-binding domain-containing protein [Sphingobacterium faecium]MDH5828860.1 type IV secretion system DNA-binding domain-containing protein [Sphingobacterium faecium]WGQ17057.1 type IV secretion system DNA-binding domain-containing protein [Sphingobacterium faecium]
MQESKEQQKIYGFFQKAVYMFVIIECAILFFQHSNIPVLPKLLTSFAKIPFLFPPLNAKFAQILLIVLIAIGTKPKKNQDINIVKSIVFPIIVGLFLMFGALMFIPEATDPNQPMVLKPFNMYQLLYVGMSFMGVLITLVGADNISKIMKNKLGKDRWNIEEESFDQNREKIVTDYSINIPYLFYFKKKLNNGWININPFRGTLVIGTPGSGKSFGVINPAIRQLVQKKFTLCIYDYKFPDLGKIAYYHYRLLKQNDKSYKHNFAVINLNEVEKSKRVNPLKKEYINTLAEAQEMAEAIVSSLQKGGGSSGGGSEAFFTQSAINFLASCIAFLASFENGKFSTLPHLLSFLNRSYKEIFDTLFSNEELHSLLSPFKSSYDNKAFDQLEGQVGTLKIFLSRLATKESFWVFSGDELDFKISNPENPTIIILASDPNTQDINSALYSVVLNRLLKLINSKGNLPSGIIADELPTIYIHKIDNLIATARSNKVAVLLGLQEIPQFKQFYKKEVADTITAIVGNIFSGSARDKSTLDWLERVFGKVKQKSQSMSVNNNQTTISINEKMDNLIPAGKIASLKTGEMVGIIAQDEQNQTMEYKTSAINGKINLNMNEIKIEEENYLPLPTYYNFHNEDGVDKKNDVLITNFRKINKEVDFIVKEFVL